MRGSLQAGYPPTAPDRAVFFVAACAISWAAWLPLARAGPPGPATRPSWLQYLHLIGALGPAVAAYLVTAWANGRRGISELTKRSLQWRVGWRWLAFALLGPTLMYLVAVLGVGLVTGSWTGLARYGKSAEYPNLPPPLYWLGSVIFYGFGEEVGWRGYFIPRLQEKWSGVAGSTSVYTTVSSLAHTALLGRSGPESNECHGNCRLGTEPRAEFRSHVLALRNRSVVPAAVFMARWISPLPRRVRSCCRRYLGPR